MAKRVLDVGNCEHDHGQIKHMLREHFQADVIQVDDVPQALDRLREEPFDLVTVNRMIDCDGSDGMELIKAIKQDPQLQPTRVMMITNYPEHQTAAVAAGALPGFGKRALGAPETLDRLRAALETA